MPTSERILYYYVMIAENVPPEGSVVIMPNVLILAPTLSDTAYGPDTVTNIRIALESMIDDAHNREIIRNLDIDNITFSEGHTDVVLKGEISGAGDVVLIAARMMILMTVFTDVSVQTATVTLNGDTIGNLGVSNSMDAKPVDYVYTRAEIETFIAENAYASP